MTVRKGVLKAFTAGTYLADVLLDGSLSNKLTSVPTSRAIASGDMTAGRFVAVLQLDPANPSDHVIIAVWT